ncbi:hypothetical protein [Oceanimonas marisflavi]|uniref:hypothetical protein n=1 Tax=Oceanimonas marisflavi TaxID=2059724 RepID=UPI000D3061FE|nr:hypothetical protein [Oceanimonas marisflavi]
MSLEFLEQARNEPMARRELTIQSHALLVVRTLDSIYSALQRKPFDGVDFDALAAIMSLFDAMLYYADRERQPGMTRKEAEWCLVEHLKEAYPGQDTAHYAQVAGKVFTAIKDPFRLRYYDFTARAHSDEQVVRLIRHDQVSGSDDILWSMTDEGMLFYTLRLDETPIERAAILAWRTLKTIRRGEIDKAVHQIQSTQRQLEQYLIGMRMKVRAAQSGDLSASYAHDIRPVLSDSFDKTQEVLEHIQNTLSTITEMLADGRSALHPDKLHKLRQAQETFAEVSAFTLGYQDRLHDVNKDFERARLKLILPRDNTLFRETLEKGALQPLLALAPATAEQGMDELVTRLLAPRSQEGDQHTLLDLEAVLNLYLDQFDQVLPREIQDPTEQPVAIETTLRGISESVLRHCSNWVSDCLKARGRVSFAEVFDAYANGELSELEQQVCLLHIGSLAANSDPCIAVDVDDAPIETALWRADNITLLTTAPTPPFEDFEE